MQNNQGADCTPVCVAEQTNQTNECLFNNLAGMMNKKGG